MKLGRPGPSPSGSDAALSVFAAVTVAAAVGFAGLRAVKSARVADFFSPPETAAPVSFDPGPSLAKPSAAPVQVERAAAALPPAAVPPAAASSPLPFAEAETRHIDETVSQSYTPAPELQNDDDLRAVKEAPAAPKPFAAPHLRALPNQSGYLDGEQTRSQAFYAVGGGAPAAKGAPAAGVKSAHQGQMAAMLAAISRVMPGASHAPARSRGAGTGATGFGYGATGNLASLTGAGDQRSSVPAPNLLAAGGPAIHAVLPRAQAFDQAVAPFAGAVGKSVVIYLAPWCHFCRSGLPVVRAMADDLRAQGIHTTIVVGQDTPDHLAQFAAEVGRPVTVDNENRNPLHGVPAFVVAQNGRVTATHMGVFNTETEGRDWALAH